MNRLVRIGPCRLAAAQHLARAEALFEGMLGQGARLPSQRRYQAREREGVQIPKAMYEEIQALLVE